MAETSYINYGTTQSNVAAELKVYYNVVTRTASSVTIDIDIGVHYTSQWSSNGCWVKVDGVNRSCNPNHITGKYYWYASSQGNSRSAYWKRVTLSAAAANTSVALSVGFSNTAFAAGTFQTKSFALTIPIGNTNAYWSNATCSVSPSGTIAENTNQLTVSWSGAKDDQGDTIYYYVEMWKNGTFTGTYVGGAGTTATRGTVDISGDAPGTSYYFRTHCKDSASSSRVFGKQSSTVTKNYFTSVSSFNISSPTVITPGLTYSMTCNHNYPSNTNGNTSFTYSLSAYFVNSYGNSYTLSLYGVTSAKVAASTFNVIVWDETGSTPTDIYIKQADIKSACASYASSTYTGTLRLKIACTNAYGSSGIIQADKSLNWQYTPVAPSAPVYSTSSYYTLPNSSDPVFIINKRAITWTWGTVSDPNGTTVSYLVYSKTGNNSWVLSTTTTNTSYTTPIMGLSQSQTYQIKIVAIFSYGTISSDSGCISPQIILHYYNQPQVALSVLSRDQNDVFVKTVVTPSTSISYSIGSIAIQYSGLVTATTTTTAPPYKKTFEEQKTFSGLEETTAGNINVSYTDSIMTSIIGSTTSTALAVVTQWSALLTIREKGIGINSIAGDHTDFSVKGTTAIYGGESANQSDGSISFSTQASSNTNIYCGLYVDAAGKLRAAQDLSRDSYVYQIQSYHQSNLSMPPIRWKYMYSSTAIQKDDIFTPTVTSDWKNVMDANLSGANYSNITSNLISTNNLSGIVKATNGTLQTAIANTDYTPPGSIKLVNLASKISSGNINSYVSRWGNVCTLSVNMRMNAIPLISAWDSKFIFSLDYGYRPYIEVSSKGLSDGQNTDWNLNWFWAVKTSGEVHIQTRTTGINWSAYTNGHGLWLSTTYITGDPFPT